MVLQQVSLVERLSLSQRVPYRRFHCIAIPHVNSHHMVVFREGLQLVTPRKPELHNVTQSLVKMCEACEVCEDCEG